MSRVVSTNGVVAIALVGLVVAGGVLWSFSGVKVEARLHDGSVDDRCPIDSPIQVSVANHTLQRLASVNVVVEGWRSGDSRNVLDGKSLAFTKVLNPLQSGVACFSDVAFKVVPSKADSVKEDAQQVALLKRRDALVAALSSSGLTKEQQRKISSELYDLEQERYTSITNAGDRGDVEQKFVRVSLSATANEIAEYKRLSSGVELVVTEFTPDFK